MPEFLLYLLRVSAWLVPMYLLYLAVFRRFTFFSANRFYLLLTLTLPFVLPFLQYTVIDRQFVEAAPIFQGRQLVNDAVLPEAAALPASTGIAPEGAVNWWLALLIIYGIIAGTVLFRFAASILQVRRLIRSSSIMRRGKLRLAVHPSATVPASFFNYIFISEATMRHPEFEAIVAHEATHVRKRHTLDLLLCALAKAVLWFNPAVWYCRRSLQEVHEFEADRSAAGRQNIGNYAGLLLQLASGPAQSLTHRFSAQPVKTRIKMLFTPKTNIMKRFAYLLVLPVVILLFMAFGNIKRKTELVYKPGGEFVLMIDAGHGGTDKGAVVRSGLVEKDINLSLARELQQLAEAAGIKVVMTRTGDESVDVKKRTELAAREKAGFLLSLHTAVAESGGTEKGIRFYGGLNTDSKLAAASLEAINYLGRSMQQLEGIEVAPSVVRRDASIWILKQAPCPSVLVECGFLSHPGDAAYLSSRESRGQMVKAILEGIVEYVKNNASAKAPSAPAATDEQAMDKNTGTPEPPQKATVKFKNLVLYSEVENPVAVTVPEGFTDITTTLSDGKVVKKTDSEFTLRFPGPGARVMKVFGNKDGRKVLLGNFNLIIQPIGRPLWQIPGTNFRLDKQEGC